MENGVQNVDKTLTEEETKTADGAVSELKLVDNVVQVFHEPEGSEGNDVETKVEDDEVLKLEESKDDVVKDVEGLKDDVVKDVEGLKDEEGGGGAVETRTGDGAVETRTGDGAVETRTGDGAVSQLKLVDNVVRVFHESKNSEGDDVFEEAIADVNAEEVNVKPDVEGTVVNGGENVEKVGGDDVVVEVNGRSNDVDKFEEAVESYVASEDQSTEVEKAVIDDDEKLALVGESEKLVDEARGLDIVVDDGDVNVEDTKSFDSLEVNASSNELDKFEEVNEINISSADRNEQVEQVIVAEDAMEELAAAVDEVKEVRSEQADQSIVMEDVIEALADADLVDEVKVVDGIVDDDKLKNVVSEEASNGVVGEEDVGVDSTVVMDGENGSLSNGEGEASVPRDAVVDDKSENGVLDVEQKPHVLEASSVVDQVIPGEIELSEGNESSEQASGRDDQGLETSGTMESVNTSCSKVVDSPELRSVSRTLDAPVALETEVKEIISPSSVENNGITVNKKSEADAPETEVSNGPSTESIAENSDNRVSVQEPEVEVKNVQEKKESLSAGKSGDSKSARAPEIQPAVEPAQPPPARPAGLGSAAPLLDPAPRAVQQQSRVNGAASQRQTQIVEDSTNGDTEENDETREKLQMIRVKFLRLAHRLGQTPHNVVVAQVLYRLGLAEQLRGRNTSRAGAFSFDRASAMAEQIEAAGQEPLDFSCTIMVLGKTGVGKSATINSIFDEVKFSTDAFQMGTKKVQDVVGTVQGIKVRVIDTPGLLPCWSDQRHNEKILHSVKRFIKKNPPDIVLYLDRLDMQTRDFGDLPLLRTITEIFGPSIWFNAIVVLTHAASAPPDGPNGISSSYEMFVTQRSHVVQTAIRQAAGDMRLMNPVSLVENHSACRTNRAGQRVLPNGQVWKPHLLLLSFASKILAEANTLLKLQDSPPGKPFATRSRVPPLPFLLSSLLQSRPQLKLPEEQFGDEDDMDEDLDESSDSDGESEYDELPPFKRLTKAQLAKLSKSQKKAYFDELEYREKLFMKKQLREEKRRRRLFKKMAASAKDLPSDYNENTEEESGAAGSVPVAMPDFTLPASFDSDNPTHRYRFLDTSNQWLVRPVLETHGWDHDVGYEGINVERLFVVKEKVPLSFSGQVTKDKKESNLQMELASSIKHSESKATSLGLDMHTVGKDMAYTLRSETRFSNFRNNKTAAGLSVTLLGEAVTAGVKLEDKLVLNKRLKVVLTGGAMTGRGDVAYGGSLEATLRDKDYPLGRALSTLGLSVMDWHGDLAIGCNLQSQIPIGRTTNLVARANLNNRGAGQISIRLNSAEQLQIALIGLLPLLKKLSGRYQQMMYGE